MRKVYWKVGRIYILMSKALKEWKEGQSWTGSTWSSRRRENGGGREWREGAFFLSDDRSHKTWFLFAFYSSVVILGFAIKQAPWLPYPDSIPFPAWNQWSWYCYENNNNNNNNGNRITMPLTLSHIIPQRAATAQVRVRKPKISSF